MVRQLFNWSADVREHPGDTATQTGETESSLPCSLPEGVSNIKI